METIDLARATRLCRLGRVACAHAAKHTLGDEVKATSLKQLTDGGITGDMDESKLAEIRT